MYIEMFVVVFMVLFLLVVFCSYSYYLVSVEFAEQFERISVLHGSLNKALKDLTALQTRLDKIEGGQPGTIWKKTEGETFIATPEAQPKKKVELDLDIPTKILVKK